MRQATSDERGTVQGLARELDERGADGESPILNQMGLNHWLI